MTLLDVMERHGYTLERLAGAIGIAPEALNRKMVENSFTIGDAQRIIEALNLTAEQFTTIFFPNREKTVFIVQACVNVRGQMVDLFNGVYASLAGARDSVALLARRQGKAIEWEDRDRLGAWHAQIGADRYSIAETALHD